MRRECKRKTYAIWYGKYSILFRTFSIFRTNLTFFTDYINFEFKVHSRFKCQNFIDMVTLSVKRSNYVKYTMLKVISRMNQKKKEKRKGGRRRIKHYELKHTKCFEELEENKEKLA